MTERARVAGALKCFQTKQKPCRGCDYNPRPGTLWPYGCGRGEYDIAEDAKRLLREDGTTKEREENERMKKRMLEGLSRIERAMDLVRVIVAEEYKAMCCRWAEANACAGAVELRARERMSAADFLELVKPSEMSPAIGAKLRDTFPEEWLEAEDDIDD